MALITVSDVRKESGVKEAEVPDSRIVEKITWAEALIERHTMQWFESRSLDFYMDGTGSRTLFLPVPIISVTALYVNDDFTNALDSDSYVVYNRTSPFDDRRNPRIKLKSKSWDLFSTVGKEGIFSRGEQNQRVVGTFGFVESDGSTPSRIKYACLKLVLKNLKPVAGTGSQHTGSGAPDVASSSIGFKTFEAVDDHQVSYSVPKMGTISAGTVRATGDPEIDSILSEYRSPLLIRSAGGRR